jgi:muramidase (phage lysozyme)
MPLPPAPTHRASLLSNKNIQPSEKNHLTIASASQSAAVKKSSSKKSTPVKFEEPTSDDALEDVSSTPTMSSSSRATPPELGKKPKARKKSNGPTKLFVLDTNVLMHDPMCLFQFEEHDVYLPMIVLEELDSHKKGMTEVARNARQTSRSLDALAATPDTDMKQGLPLSGTGHIEAGGKLFFQTQIMDVSLPMSLPQGKADNQILGVVQALGKLHAPREVVLVSKDINMRVKARALGLAAEDYQNDKVLEDGDLMYSGALALPADFWNRHGKAIESWQQGSHTFYRFSGPIVPSLLINQFVYLEAPGEPNLYARVTEIRGKTAVLKTLKDFGHAKNAVWGVTTRNREQNFAMNMLTDPEVDFVTLAGTAGTGRGNTMSLLDIIGRGESGGNYNALVGGGSANLTGMTIAEVQQLQSTMVKGGRPSTAVGKYQMIAATLAEQVKKAGLDPNKTKFDQHTQDLLASQLVGQAGYGTKDSATVMKNLAGTWASLPQDMSGRGRYDGYNTNKANISASELMSAIQSGPRDSYSSNLKGVDPSAARTNTAGAETASAVSNARNSNDLIVIQIAKMDELIGLMKANNSQNQKMIQVARN